MLPVTVTGSAFDRKIVSVLPVPFCQVLARASHDLTNVIYRGVAGKEKGGQQPLLLTSISSINVIGKSNFSDRGS